ncbi:MAG TPA: 30S ribosomal protein S17 [Geobacterales bacterium]|nr:30S ribosomal protein S17 [Geobacterales bacterium]
MSEKGRVIFGIEAPAKSCDDINCPFHGNLSVRGRLDSGVVIKLKAMKTAVVEKEYLVFIRKYQRYERRRSKYHVHVPSCIKVKEGDKVIFGECRPLAKTVSSVILKVL